MTDSPHSNTPKCPTCGGNIDFISESQSISNFLASMIGAEIFMYIVAGILFTVGIFWYPALIIGLIMAVYIFFIKNKDIYLCKRCGNQIKPSELYKNKNT